MDKKIKNNNKKTLGKGKIFLFIIIYFLLFILGFDYGCSLERKQEDRERTTNIENKILEQKQEEDTSFVERERSVAFKRYGEGDNNNNLSDDTKVTDVYKPDGEKVAYLTFDDGPSPNITPGILDILKKYKIKATFFVVGNLVPQNSSIVKREWEEGNSVGNHSFSHDYNLLYSSPSVFVQDINKCDLILKAVLGKTYNYKLIRFPGGSFGAKLAPYRQAITNAGYHYIDWNDLTGDAEARNVPVSKLLSELVKYTKGNEHVVILMHDAPEKTTTLKALPQVIEYLKSQGYTFKTLR